MIRYLLGVDPGLVGTGWCLAAVPAKPTDAGVRQALVTFGTIKPPGPTRDLAERLDALWTDVSDLARPLDPAVTVALVERPALAGAYRRVSGQGRQLNAAAMETNHYATGVILAALAAARLPVEHPRVGTRRKETAHILVAHYWPQVSGPHAKDAAHLVLARLLDGRLRRAA